MGNKHKMYLLKRGLNIVYALLANLNTVHLLVSKGVCVISHISVKAVKYEHFSFSY